MIAKCPFNYTGSKHGILDQLLPLFPPMEGRVLCDLFAGGGSVGVNAEAEVVLFNDLNRAQLGLLEYMYHTPSSLFLEAVQGCIAEYGLSESSRYGYAHYGADSTRGLAESNKSAYLRLRDDFNLSKQEAGTMDYVKLYTLLIFGFNNQLRFNTGGAFNTPVGKRDFNRAMQHKLVTFMQRLKSKDARFAAQDFRACLRDLSASEEYAGRLFVYCDPPYLITTATYNERGGWGEQDELDLLAALDELDAAGVYFGLSNVTHESDKANPILLEWIKSRPYKVCRIKKSYRNSNYHKQTSTHRTREVYITNYHL